MSVIAFRSDQQTDSESAYKDWLLNNPEGFVINALKSTAGKGSKTDDRFTRIHRASCKTINPLLSKIDKTAFTTGQYQKLCTSSLSVADNEARVITGLASIKRCPCI